MFQVNVEAYLSIMWIFLGAVTSYIMWKYPDHKHFPYHSYPTIWLEYFCAIGIPLLAPLMWQWLLSEKQIVNTIMITLKLLLTCIYLFTGRHLF